jgi:hypothetical protein
MVPYLQPLQGHKLTENGVPAWADTFIQKFDMVKREVLDLMDAASLFRLQMCVVWYGYPL